VPAMLTVAPTAPLAGEKLLNAGEGSTSKFVLLVTVTPLVFTDIGPSVAPAGTVAVMLVAEFNVALAVMPLKNCTMAGARKFVPVIVTVAPTAPLTGKKLVIVGVGRTSKLVLLETVIPLEITEIGPSAAPAGTVAVILVDELKVALAVMPLKNLTVTGAVKFVPVIDIVAPTAPLVGEKLVIAGDGNTVKFDELKMVIPFTVMEIGFDPGAVPTGTRVSILDWVNEGAEAVVPLNDTTGVVLKFVPEIFTTVPTAPLAGLKELIVGVGSTVKFEPLVNVTPFTVTEIGPVPAPDGTLEVMLVVVKVFTTAGMPLKETEGVVRKFVPEMVTIAPTAPFAGEKTPNVGVARKVNPVLLSVMPLVVNEMEPLLAPAGTVAVIEVGEVTSTLVEATPLN